MPNLVPLSAVDPAVIEMLLDRAFEPERRRRTAYKVRGDAREVPELSFAAIDGDGLVGSIQCWPVRFVPDRDISVPLVMVGPVAVDPAHQRSGLGRRLMDHALAAAAASRRDDGLVLIGDPEYYGRFFGFTSDRTGEWRLPGPVDRHRLLARGARVPAGPGELGP
ncbi:GNAT family N-acetyltransferase [Sphingomonas sp.]|uniref:GNAT family N-acetyltransferase n=1 Tax=Sphingomonas sp. TaxID=28214 RepID=UPI003AFF9811